VAAADDTRMVSAVCDSGERGRGTGPGMLTMPANDMVASARSESDSSRSSGARAMVVEADPSERRERERATREGEQATEAPMLLRPSLAG